MRRATPLAPRLRARLRLPALLAALTLLLYAVARLDAKIQPILQEFAEYETRSAVVRLMNDAVAQEMLPSAASGPLPSAASSAFPWTHSAAARCSIRRA